jgi:hypothetical protein
MEREVGAIRQINEPAELENRELTIRENLIVDQHFVH